MNIPFFNLKKQNCSYGDELKQAIGRVVSSGYYILGPELTYFESTLAKYLSVNHVIGTGNGLDALTLIFRGYIELGVMQPGDEVIVPANTYIASALAVSASGLKPIFADVDVNTFNLSADSIKRSITAKTRAVLLVHLHGLVSDFSDIKQLCDNNNLIIVEDNAQAIGAEWEGAKSGSLGDSSAFSFYPAKNMGALGDAGAIATNNEQLNSVVSQMRNYGSSQKYIHDIKGVNTRLDEIQAAALSVKLQYIDKENSRRSVIAKRYCAEVTNTDIILPTYFDKNHVWHNFIIRCKTRDALQSYLSENGIGTMIHYPLPVHKQKAYKECNNVSLPQSEYLSNEILSLPINQILEDDEVSYIIKVLNNWQK